MHAAEPDEPSFVNDPDSSQSAAAQDAWRAVVASRVNSYRSRRRHKGTELPPALDFGPAASDDARSFAAQGHMPWRPIQPENPYAASRNAIDTNYYRRLNAESLNPASLTDGSSAVDGASEVAIAPELEAAAAAESSGIESTVEEVPMALHSACEQPLPDIELRPDSDGDPGLDRYCIANPETAPESELKPGPEETAPEPATMQKNLIVFRRPLLEPPLAPRPSRDELAEPMHNRPRILEVPEDIMPAVQGSLFPEIHLDAGESESSAPREPQIEVPLAVALVTDRLTAAAMDMGVVLVGGMIFAAIAWVALPGIPHTKPFFMALGATNLLFWAVYQHLFLLYAGRTPGMSLKGIRLSTFDGQAPQWKQRSSRARFMFISLASVLLGFLWALVDEDMLCWHDRISRTFPTTG
jgi:uncharacterized RDD family membrane protein YckC